MSIESIDIKIMLTCECFLSEDIWYLIVSEHVSYSFFDEDFSELKFDLYFGTNQMHLQFLQVDY